MMLQKLPAIHYRHHQVQDNDSGRRRVPQIIQRFATIGGRNNRVASILQHIGQRLARADVIVNY